MPEKWFCFSKLIKTFDNGFATSKYSVTNPAVPSQFEFFLLLGKVTSNQMCVLRLILISTASEFL